MTTSYPAAWRLRHSIRMLLTGRGWHPTFFVLGVPDEPHVGRYSPPYWVGCHKCGLKVEDVSSYADVWGP